MQIAEYQKEEMEIKKKQDEENTVWFVKTEGKGGNFPSLVYWGPWGSVYNRWAP